MPFHGAISSIAVDPIEKKPLYHFFPGSSVYSVGYVGCNLHCPFCQNHEISQSTTATVKYVTPMEIVVGAKASGCQAVAHTYSEPVVHAEFVIEAMRASRSAGLRSVLVTNGCARPEAAAGLLEYCDAVNVDLKAWDQDWYRNELGGDLDTVTSFITLAHRSGVHLEVTTLIVPGGNDDDTQIDGIAGFLAELSEHIPLHLSAYRPMYRYTTPATPTSTIRRLAGVAGRHLRFVYAGNLWGERNETLCPACGSVLVSREGYRVNTSGLQNGRCARCGSSVPVIS